MGKSRMAGYVSGATLLEVSIVETVKFWSRVGHWFRRAGRATGDTAEPTTARRLGLTSELESLTPSGGLASSDGQPAASFLRRRSSRSRPDLEWLEEQNARVVKLIGAVQTHLASQAEESRRVARSLERLAESLSQMPEASKQELELLTRIQDSMTADLAGTKRIEESLCQLPQLADAQREAMVSIGRQLDSSRETGERVASTLGEVQKAVGGLGEATNASAKAVQELRHDASARGERIAELVEHQTRRLTTFTWALIGLAVVAAVVGLVAVIR